LIKVPLHDFMPSKNGVIVSKQHKSLMSMVRVCGHKVMCAPLVVVGGLLSLAHNRAPNQSQAPESQQHPPKVHRQFATILKQ
jgi:hypothetical protein